MRCSECNYNSVNLIGNKLVCENPSCDAGTVQKLNIVDKPKVEKICASIDNVLTETPNSDQLSTEIRNILSTALIVES